MKEIYHYYLEKTINRYDHIDFVPPKGVREAAELGLKLRREASPSNKGGLNAKEAAEEGVGSGVQRAINLKNGDKISPETIKRMYSFFSRHSVFKNKHKSDPKGKARQSFLLWGGDPGFKWCKKIYKMMKRADEKEK